LPEAGVGREKKQTSLLLTKERFSSQENSKNHSAFVYVVVVNSEVEKMGGMIKGRERGKIIWQPRGNVEVYGAQLVR